MSFYELILSLLVVVLVTSLSVLVALMMPSLLAHTGMFVFCFVGIGVSYSEVVYFRQERQKAQQMRDLQQRLQEPYDHP